MATDPMAITMPVPCQRETRARKITIASTTVAAGYSEIKMLANDSNHDCSAISWVSSPDQLHTFRSPAQLANNFALGVPASHVLTFVVCLLASCQCKLDLDLAPQEVQRQRYQGEITIADLADQPVDFLPM